MSRRRQFSVPCVAEIDSCIGPCTAWISAYDPTDFEIECITNKWGGELSGESVSDGLWREIAEEVHQYFIAEAEAQGEAIRELDEAAEGGSGYMQDQGVQNDTETK